MLVDLHLHSQVSDGTMLPRELAAAGAARGFGLLALADHNTDAGWPEFSAACQEYDITPLRGVELDGLYDRWDLHILGYGYTPTPELAALAKRSRELLDKMSDDLVEQLLPAFSQLSLEQWQDYEADPSRGGWKGLQYLCDNDVIPDLESGLTLYHEQGCDYQNYPFPTVEELCTAINEAGGVAVLAHPCNWFASLPQLELYEHLDALVELGIGGIECHYPANTPEMTWMCRKYCRRHDLLITAGSDWHGDFNRVVRGVTYEMGQVEVTLEDLSLGRLLEP